MLKDVLLVQVLREYIKNIMYTPYEKKKLA